MALTETRPQDNAPDEMPADSAHGHLSAPSGLADGLFGTGDHVTIGRAWVAAGSLFSAAALVVGLLAAVEHSSLGSFDLVNNQNTFTQLWSAGRVLLLFAGILPILVGIGTAIVPLQVGSSALAFARGASGAFWTWLLAVGLTILAYALDGGPAGNDGDFVVLWALGLALMAAALTWALVAIATTVFGARAEGMTMSRVPLTSWGYFIFGLGGLFVLPITIAECIMAYVDVKYGYLGSADARAVLVGPLDTLTLAPGIFWLAVPVLAMAADIIGVQTGAPIRMHRTNQALIGALGFVAFSSEIFSFGSRGRTIALDNGLAVIGSLVVAGLLLVALGPALLSLKSGKLKINSPLFPAMLSGLLLVLAGLLNALAQIESITAWLDAELDAGINQDALLLNGTAFHDGLRGLVWSAALLGAFAGVQHFAHKMWGRALNNSMMLPTALAVAAGGALCGLGGLGAGLEGEPALPLVDTAQGSNTELWNTIVAVGIAVVLAGAALQLLNVAVSLLAGKGDGAEPWRGLTLEWSTTSPPPYNNFDTIPVVTSATPLAQTDGEDA